VSVIDWDTKPEWADVWVEDCASDCASDWGGWHRETDMKYFDKDDLYWLKTAADVGKIKVHHPPSERERLQNKPSWNEAPEWAEWLAQDYDGEWFWFIDRPVIYKFTFQPVKAPQGIQLASKGEVLGDWRDTLERRPEPITPPTHLNMRCIVKPIERKEWSGPEDGLPPVGWHGEIRHSGHRCWHECFVMPDNAVVIKPLLSEWSESVACSIRDTDQFRPLRTEEDKAVECMMEVIAEEFNKSGDEWAGTEDIAKAIYAAGYRKQEEPK
jgi:hypothetical protein